MKNSSLAEGGKKTTADLPTMHQRSSSYFGLAGIVATKTTTNTSSATTIPTKDQTHERGKGSDDMTLDELSCNKQNYPDDASTQSARAPSPDIATILSITPRPALSLSRSRSGDTDVRSQSRSKSRGPAGQRRVVSANTTNTSIYPENRHPLNPKRRQSEGAPTTNSNVPAHDRTSSSELAYLHNITNGLPPPSANGRKILLSRSTASIGGYYDQETEDYDEALERVLEGGSSEDEVVGVVWDSTVNRHRTGSRGKVVQEEAGGDSDSSLDLHTPLPYVSVFPPSPSTNSPHF